MATSCILSIAREFQEYVRAGMNAVALRAGKSWSVVVYTVTLRGGTWKPVPFRLKTPVDG